MRTIKHLKEASIILNEKGFHIFTTSGGTLNYLKNVPEGGSQAVQKVGCCKSIEKLDY